MIDIKLNLTLTKPMFTLLKLNQGLEVFWQIFNLGKSGIPLDGGKWGRGGINWVFEGLGLVRCPDQPIEFGY